MSYHAFLLVGDDDGTSDGLNLLYLQTLSNILDTLILVRHDVPTHSNLTQIKK